jgi:methylphosphotriester-DNA--protein-cysteine methyltransferase
LLYRRDDRLDHWQEGSTITGLTCQERNKTYTLVAADGRRYESTVKGLFGGHRGDRIYGRLNCPAAVAALSKGGYARFRVFFADEADAIAAGYRPCAACLPAKYAKWKRTR